MKTFAIIAVSAVVVGGWMFVASASESEDRKPTRTPVFFSGDDCDGTAATVNGSEGRIAWDGSKDVAIAVPSKVRWKRGVGSDVQLRGSEDDLERIRLEKGTLQVCGDIDDEVEITLPGVEFRKVTLAGAGDIAMEDVDQDELDLTIAGAGRVNADGRSNDVKLTIAGAGEAQIGKLATKRIEVDIMGAGEAIISATDDADVTIMGAGNVDLLTRPARHDFDVFGAGDINMPDQT
jgi:hypothetical protein